MIKEFRALIQVQLPYEIANVNEPSWNAIFKNKRKSDDVQAKYVKDSQECVGVLTKQR